LKRFLLAFLFIYGLSTAPVFCADQKVKDAFAQADKFAAQEKYIRAGQESKAHSREAIKNIQEIVDSLDSPSQLVDLISLCNAKVKSIPSSPQYAPYFDHFIFVEEFAISKLGKMHTAEAKAALNEVHHIISGKATLEQVWDEAKAEQDKASQK
jgi:hypothetical protein